MEGISAAEVIFTAALIVGACAGMVWILRTIVRLRLVLYAFAALLVLLWLTGDLSR
jgi:hypothetical protein